MLLNKNDFAISYHRAHAHYLAKGCSLSKMIAEIYGKKTGCSSGYGGSMHLIDKKNNFIGSTAIVSNAIPVGAGLAYTLLQKKNKSRVCIYIGDASCEEGVFFETLNFVILKKLPVIFFCENNKYSVYSDLSKRQPLNRKLFRMTSAMGIKSFRTSSSNPIKLLKDLEKIINKNQLPLFIEVDTYRFLEHCGPNYDDYLKYRPKKEVEYWLSKDSMALVENFILKKNICSAESLNKIKNKINKSIITAFKFAEKSEYPNFNEFLKIKI